MYLALARDDQWEVWQADPPRPWRFRRLKEADLITAVRPDADFRVGEPVCVYGTLTVTTPVLRGEMPPLMDVLSAEMNALTDDLAAWCAGWERGHVGRQLVPFGWGWVEQDGAILTRDPSRDAYTAMYFLYAHDVPVEGPTYVGSREVEEHTAADLMPLLSSLHRLRRGA